MLVFRAGFHKRLVSIANGEDPDQTASSTLKALSSTESLLIAYSISTNISCYCQLFFQSKIICLRKTKTLCIKFGNPFH